MLHDIATQEMINIKLNLYIKDADEDVVKEVQLNIATNLNEGNLGIIKEYEVIKKQIKEFEFNEVDVAMLEGLRYRTSDDLKKFANLFKCGSRLTEHLLNAQEQVLPATKCKYSYRINRMH